MGQDVVFALDEALMCSGDFNGHNEEYLIWVYGNNTLSRFNGVIILGNEISEHQIKSKNGLRFTDFNRTLIDAFTNEDILDMQGTTEAVSYYYYSHNNSFEGIYVPPIYQDRFDQLAIEAINYYDN